MANLYVFHQGIGGDGIHLWYSVYDGASWAPDTLVLDGALDLSDPPSAVAWADGISVLHQGWNRQGRPPADSFGTRIPLMAQTGAEIRLFRT
jgi:hypothetical protein